MLELRSLEMTNFGPFKGRQQMDLPDDGVSLVYGENMRGKTSLLNAFRYGFYGLVRGRGGKNIDLHKVGNWEAAEEGDYGFKVALTFDKGGDRFELIRACELEDNVREPTSEKDYRENLFLKKDGVNLGPDQRDRLLAELLPQQVSRFFLFDGELLQQYENLLLEEDQMGDEIAKAIERILGIPVLKNSRIHMRQLKEGALEKQTKIAKKDKRTEQIASRLEGFIERRDRHRSNIEDREKKIEDLEEEKRELEAKLKQSNRVESIIEDKDKVENKLDDVNFHIEEQEEKRRELMENAWKWILQPEVEDRLSSLREKSHEVEKNQSQASLLESLTEGSDGNGQCPVCEQALSVEQSETIKKELLSDVGDLDELRSQYRILSRRGAALSRFTDGSGIGKLQKILSIEDKISELEIERTDLKEQVEDLEQELEEVDEERIRRIKRELENTIEKLTGHRKAVKKEKESLQNAEDKIQHFQKKMQQIGDVDLEAEQNRVALLEDLHELFQGGITHYRDDLRDRVEQQATDYFLNLTTEPEYEGLEINDTYGLTIVHESGAPIEVRSSGAEHIVALSLIGALQRNASLRGPIIMDSPFGRLDEGHTRNVIETLPKMSKQVMLLAFEGEVDPQLARDILGADLQREYEMVRRSARHTDLKPRRK